VYIGEDLIIASMISEKTCNLTIGDRVAIGPRTTLILSSDANWSNLMLTIKPIRGEIILEKDCWIGAGAIILPNITIGESAIVGAGAVVTKDVNASEIVVGVPAKKIKS
jgi:acetyltransferase-like isoleucine patch superfamily enzyme